MSTSLHIAYIVVAHRDPDHCRRLVEALASGTTRLFVHVDARCEIAPFYTSRPGVEYVERRLRVNRGGWSLTRTMYQSLHRAYTASDCDYFVFLAGTDYPLRSNERISAFLAAHHPKCFINYFPCLPGTSGYTNFSRYHFVDLICRLTQAVGRPRVAHDDRVDRMPWLPALANRWMPPRSFPAGFVPFRGSDRWCLSRRAVGRVLETWSSPAGVRLRHYFRTTWGSDEMLFQTILFNSDIASECHLFEAEAVHNIVEGRIPPWPDEVKAFLHYVDWDPAREDPAILDERDLAALEASDALFACKFLSHRSATLLDRIDHELRGASSGIAGGIQP